MHRNIYYNILIILIIILLGGLSFGFRYPESDTSEKIDVTQIYENYRIFVVNAKSLKNAKKIAEKLNEIINRPVYIERQNNDCVVQIGGIQTVEEAQSIEKKLKLIGIKSSSIIKVNKPYDGEISPSVSSFDAVLPSNSKPDLYITDINSTIKIDGKFSEPEWNSSSSSFSGYFSQQEPFDRVPSTEKTEIKILSDDKNLYFGILCYYKEPDKIFAKTMRRDGRLFGEDNIEIFLDTYKDGRNSFYFSTNPFGAKVDAIITDEGSFVNQDWDAVWYCKTSRDDKGWYAEICIPFKSLRFKEGKSDDWGINIGREIAYKNESTFIVPIPRALSHRGKYKASLFANLKNVKNPSNGRNINIIPYMSGGRIHDYELFEGTSRFNRGFDVQYSVTPNLVADFTYKTDFAQVESDDEIVNFSRFNINLPEKREFFLQSAGLFSFGGSGSRRRGGGRSSSYLLFNSRAIGIYDEKEIPLLGGAKLSGKAGKYTLGFLNIQTEKKKIEDSYTEPTTNYTALKVKRDILKNSNIGMMFLNKQNNEGYYDRAVGLDSYFSFNNEYSINASIANNIKPDIKDKNWAGTFRAAVNKDWIEASINYTRLDTLFKPDMGFIRRENVRSTSGKLEFTKWLNNRYFKSISLDNDISYLTDHHNVLNTRRYEHRLSMRFASGDLINFGINREYEFLPEEDEIREIKLDPGIYNATSQSISFFTYSSRPVYGRVFYIWGEEYDGKRNYLSLSNSIKISNNFNIYFSYAHTKITLKNGEAKSNLASGRFSYSFNPQLYAKYYLQWNDADKQIVGNFLLDYIFKPKSHIYLVYNENRYSNMPLLKSIRDRALLVKITYLWNI